MHRHTLLKVAAWVAIAAVARGDDASVHQVPWLTEVQQRPADLTIADPQLAPVLIGEDGNEIQSRPDWERQRARLRTAWLEFLGPLSRDHLAAAAAGRPRPAPTVTVLSVDRVDGVVRQLIRYEVESAQPVEAYLLQPENLTSPAPGVVVFHSTVNESLRQPAGVEGAPEKAFGLELAKRGCVAICPRNYLWPENHRIDARGEAERFLQRHPQSKGMDRMLLDGLVAVDLLIAHPHVDRNRIGCIGHSLGAKEVLYLAAFDERIRATVSSEGGIGTKFSNWHDAWYLGPAIQQPDFVREHHELLALTAPRAFLLVGGDSADGDQSWPFIEAAMPTCRLYLKNTRLGLLNHHQGHSVPPEAQARMLEWLLAYL